MYIRESTHFNGKELALETGQIARQAEGAVVATHGDTKVLVTVVTAEPRDDVDYFPLRVDYEERFYAAGKIPGGFFKREGRPSDAAILTARMIDRPIRPLFPKGYNDEVQIIATVLSAESDCPPNALAILTASAALTISSAPFAGPIAGVNVGRKDGQFVLNPNPEILEEGGVDITVAGTKDTVTMVEGMMNELSEDEVVEAIEVAHAGIRELIALQERFAAQLGPSEKKEVSAPVEDIETIERARELVWKEFATMPTLDSKKARGDFLDELKKHAVERLVAPTTPADEIKDREKAVGDAVEKLHEAYMRQQILDRGVRIDGRRPEEVRSISCQVSVLPRTHGSSLFTRGETQSLGIVTLGAARGDEQIIDQMMSDGRKRFMLHYNFPPFSVGEVRRIGSPSRRSIGHGYLAENSLRAVMPTEEEFPYVVRVVSEILESNGSSSMATVCSGSLAMMDAGVPLKKAVAGIAMGMIEDPATNRRVILTDIQGAEDHHGDMDFKVVGTTDGVTGFQLDVKVGGVDSRTMREALEQARTARMHILEEMRRAISSPREEMSPFAPKLLTIQIPQEKIGLVIGPGGKTIRQIVEDTGAEIDIADDGTVKIAAVDGAAAEAARQTIEDMTAELEVGMVFDTKVTRIADFGAFVELKGGGEGLVHVSNLASGFVDKVTDHVSVGDAIRIEVIGQDKMGRPDLKRLEPGEEPGGGSRKERGGRGRGGGNSKKDAHHKRSAPAPHIKAGDIIHGTVSNTTDYGAFVELAPDVTGLVHISALSDEYVRRVTDVVRSGDEITVEVLNVDERGRYKLKRIDPDQPEGEEAAEDEADGSDGFEDVEMPQAATADAGRSAMESPQTKETEKPAPTSSDDDFEDEEDVPEEDKQPPLEFEDRW